MGQRVSTQGLGGVEFIVRMTGVPGGRIIHSSHFLSKSETAHLKKWGSIKWYASPARQNTQLRRHIQPLQSPGPPSQKSGNPETNVH